MKKIALFGLLSFMGTTSAQRMLSPGVYVCYYRTFDFEENHKKKGIMGFMANFESAKNGDDLNIVGRLTIGLLSVLGKEDSMYVMEKPNHNTYPPQMYAKCTRKVSMLCFGYDVKWYPGKDRTYEKGGFYLSWGVNGILTRAQFKYDETPTIDNYTLPGTEKAAVPAKFIALEPNLRLAPGFEKKAGPVIVFGEVVVQSKLNAAYTLPESIRYGGFYGINLGAKMFIE